MFFICLSYVLLLNIVKSDSVQLTFMNGSHISDQDYCVKRNCILKCCPAGRIMKFIRGSDGNLYDVCRKISKNVTKAVNFTKLSLYTAKELNETRKNVESEFILVYDKDFFNESLRLVLPAMLIEDGSLQLKGQSEFSRKLSFCIDFLYKQTPTGITAVFSYRIGTEKDDSQTVFKNLFVAIGLLISAFFMTLVLLVYGLLPSIRGGLRGIILMSYLTAASINYILKAIQLIAVFNEKIGRRGCQLLTPVVYYTMLANFFWSNILTYQMWKNLSNIKDPSSRLSRKPIGQLDVKDKKKIVYYNLYAWGVPAMITWLVILVDTEGWYADINTKPPFEDCFYNQIPVMLYLNVPIGVMTIVNCIFFVRTIYYIWTVKSGLNNEFTKSTAKARRHNYTLYMKISALMGVSWLLELIPSDIGLILYIIVSFYNIFMGAIIFFILLWNRKVLFELFAKFGIMQNYVAKYKGSSSRELESRSISKQPSKDRSSSVTIKLETVI